MPRGSNGYVPWPSLRSLQRLRRGCIVWGRFGLNFSYCCNVVCCLCWERAYCRAKGFAVRVRSQLATSCVVTLVQTSRTHQCCSFAPRWMVNAHTLAVRRRFSSVSLQPPIQPRATAYFRPRCGFGQLYIGLSSIQHVRCFDQKAYICSPPLFWQRYQAWFVF